MKKLLLFFTVAAVVAAMTGCDASYYFYYVIENGTQSELDVKIGGRDPIIIRSGDKARVLRHSELGDPGGRVEFTPSGKYVYILYKVTPVTINGQPITSSDFWLSEYWAFKRDSKFSFTFTMVLTDELIERLVSKEEEEENI